jgi:hypothetical protein
MKSHCRFGGNLVKHIAIVSIMLAVGSGLLLRGLTAAEEKAQSERQPCAVRRS